LTPRKGVSHCGEGLSREREREREQKENMITHCNEQGKPRGIKVLDANKTAVISTELSRVRAYF